MDGQTYGWMENLPILQDFVPYRGRCPATAQLQPKNCIKRGKGTADHMMPLGDWFSFFLSFIHSFILSVFVLGQKYNLTFLGQNFCKNFIVFKILIQF